MYNMEAAISWVFVSVYTPLFILVLRSRGFKAQIVCCSIYEPVSCALLAVPI